MYARDGDLWSQWLSYVHKTFNEMGLLVIWLTQDILDKRQKTLFKTTIKTCINDQFMTKWRATVGSSLTCTK